MKKELDYLSAERLWKMFFPHFGKPHGIALVQDLWRLRKIACLIFAAAIATLFTGCATSVRDQVPATQITGSLAGQPFTFTGPKNITMTNFVAEANVTTNGATRVRVSIGSISAAVDPAIITMTGQAYTAMRAADSALINSAISSASAAIGSAAGSAAAAGVTGK